jgi:hypothetical protein
VARCDIGPGHPWFFSKIDNGWTVLERELQKDKGEDVNVLFSSIYLSG